MGLAGDIGGALSIVGSFVPGIGTTLATVGAAAAALDPTDPEARVQFPETWRWPWGEGGPLWGVPMPRQAHARDTWRVSAAAVEPSYAASGSLTVPGGASWTPTTADAWVGREPFRPVDALPGARLVTRSALVAGGSGAHLGNALNAEAVRRRGAERLIGGRFRVEVRPQLASIPELRGSGVLTVEVLGASGRPGTIGATPLVVQAQRVLEQWAGARQLAEAEQLAPEWPDLDLRTWEQGGAADAWHDPPAGVVIPSSGLTLRPSYSPGGAPGPYVWLELGDQRAREAREWWDARRAGQLERYAERLELLEELRAQAALQARQEEVLLAARAAAEQLAAEAGQAVLDGDLAADFDLGDLLEVLGASWGDQLTLAAGGSPTHQLAPERTSSPAPARRSPRALVFGLAVLAGLALILAVRR